MLTDLCSMDFSILRILIRSHSSQKSHALYGFASFGYRFMIILFFVGKPLFWHSFKYSSSTVVL